MSKLEEKGPMRLGTITGRKLKSCEESKRRNYSLIIIGLGLGMGIMCARMYVLISKRICGESKR